MKRFDYHVIAMDGNWKRHLGIAGDLGWNVCGVIQGEGDYLPLIVMVKRQPWRFRNTIDFSRWKVRAITGLIIVVAVTVSMIQL